MPNLNANAATLRGRAAAEALMQDTCRIERIVTSTTDQDTGEVVETKETVYEGKCRFQAARSFRTFDSGTRNVGERYFYIDDVLLQVPMTVDGVQNEDACTCVTSVLDTALVGKEFVIQGLMMKSHSTTRRYALKYVNG